MVTKILNGIAVTATDYQTYARPIWIVCFCLGILIAMFGRSPVDGALLITCCVVGLPAYLISQANRANSKKRRK